MIEGRPIQACPLQQTPNDTSPLSVGHDPLQILKLLAPLLTTERFIALGFAFMAAQVRGV